MGNGTRHQHVALNFILELFLSSYHSITDTTTIGFERQHNRAIA